MKKDCGCKKMKKDALPEIPVSWLAIPNSKSITILQKGERLASFLNRTIDGMDDMRGDIIRRMGRAAGISASTVNQILAGDIECPPINRLRGFARVLPVSQSAILRAAERDGCDYGMDDE